MADTTTIAPSPEKKSFSASSMGFFNDVAKEMRKVSWPTREALQDATLVTLVGCILLALFTFGVDKVFELAIRAIFRML